MERGRQNKGGRREDAARCRPLTCTGPGAGSARPGGGRAGREGGRQGRRLPAAGRRLQLGNSSSGFCSHLGVGWEVCVRNAKRWIFPAPDAALSPSGLSGRWRKGAAREQRRSQPRGEPAAGSGGCLRPPATPPGAAPALHLCLQLTSVQFGVNGAGVTVPLWTYNYIDCR